jgi:hypothetical protein
VAGTAARLAGSENAKEGGKGGSAVGAAGAVSVTEAGATCCAGAWFEV